jgi:hypothetical protein
MNRSIVRADALSKSASQTAPSRFAEIPPIIYREISEKLGKGEEKTSGRYLRYRLLDPSSPVTGFPGVIGLHVFDEGRTDFGLWHRMPEGDGEWFADLPQVLKIEARPMSTGIWAYGRGTEKQDVIMAAMYSDGWPLDSPEITLVSLCMLRASQLARNPSCRPGRFWDQRTAFEDEDD